MSNRFKWILLGLEFGLLLSVCGCSGGKSVQNKLAPDPKLGQPTSTSGAVGGTAAQSSNPLPADFPTYPQAKFQSTDRTPEGSKTAIWTTADPIDFVYAFYQKELPAKQWEIVTQPTDSEPQLLAKKADLNVSIGPAPTTDKPQTGVTVFSVSLLDRPVTPSPVATTPSPTATNKSSQEPTQTASNPDYLADLTQLGILTKADIANRKSTVSRREYVRWLVAAYNRINSTKPTQQIKLAPTDTKPTFSDVPASNPDFPSIQGLAEAGLIPSALSGDATNVLFRPEAPLTREELILWKVPLDTHAALPTASLDAIKQAWGFQDAAKIDPKAIRALLADFQNGDRSNVRRVFGYTTLFQPKKTVNLSEVAATIWYFGANSEGTSAHEAISTK
jgi:S-layer homology domain